MPNVFEDLYDIGFDTLGPEVETVTKPKAQSKIDLELQPKKKIQMQ